MKTSLKQPIFLAIAGALSAAGCQVSVTPGQFAVVAPAPVVVAPAVVVDGPVITGPGVEVVQVEPDPAYRVYVYDPGFPPGVYFYNNFYWYGGYRYQHDVFVNRYVTVNLRDHRYMDREENRRAGVRIEAQHRTEYARTRGVRPNRGPSKDVHSTDQKALKDKKDEKDQRGQKDEKKDEHL